MDVSLQRFEPRKCPVRRADVVAISNTRCTRQNDTAIGVGAVCKHVRVEGEDASARGLCSNS